MAKKKDRSPGWPERNRRTAERRQQDGGPDLREHGGQPQAGLAVGSDERRGERRRNAPPVVEVGVVGEPGTDWFPAGDSDRRPDAEMAPEDLEDERDTIVTETGKGSWTETLPAAYRMDPAPKTPLTDALDRELAAGKNPDEAVGAVIEQAQAGRHYGLAAPDRLVPVLIGPLKVGKKQHHRLTFVDPLSGKSYREAQAAERAHAVRPRVGNDGEGSSEHGRYVRLVEVGREVEIMEQPVTGHTHPKGDTTMSAKSAVKAKLPATPAPKVTKVQAPIPTKRDLPLDKLGDWLTATRYVVQTYGAEESSKTLRARVEAVYGKKYRPGTIATVRRELKVAEPKSPKPAPVAAVMPKGKAPAKVPAPKEQPGEGGRVRAFPKAQQVGKKGTGKARRGKRNA